MKKIVSLIAVLSIWTLNVFFPAAYVRASDPQGWDRPHRVSEIIGLWVTNHEGRYFGKVQDLLFDPAGHVTFAIIGYSRFNWRLINDDSVAVPFNALAYSESGKHPAMVAQISFEKFKSAPRFAKDDLMNRQKVAEIYRYFGQQPYWTDHRTSK